MVELLGSPLYDGTAQLVLDDRNWRGQLGAQKAVGGYVHVKGGNLLFYSHRYELPLAGTTNLGVLVGTLLIV